MMLEGFRQDFNEDIDKGTLHLSTYHSDLNELNKKNNKHIFKQIFFNN